MYDLLIENAHIVDGTGSPSRYGDVAVQNGEIVTIGKVNGAGAKKTINADGIKATIVSCAVLYQEGAYQGGLPGQVLRSYDA